MALFEIKNLSKSYKNKQALKDVSFEVNSGEIVALIGRNGAGKTTMLNCISGMISPDSGDVTYKNESVLKDDSLLNEFGILIEGSFYDYMDAYDNLVLLMRASGVKDKNLIKKRIDETLSLVGLREKKHKYVKTFSFGMKQRLGLAQTLLTDTRFLILDEPFVGLDPLGKNILKKMIIEKAKEQGAGILFSSHDLDDVLEICDRIVMIDNGEKIYDDVFIDSNKYEISLTSLEGKDLDRLKNDLPRWKAVLRENKIEFTERESLYPILEYCVSNNIVIPDMRVKQRTLYDFFEEEVM